MKKNVDIKNWDVRNRWAEGISHNADAELTAKMMSDLDRCHFSDSFKFKLGGDGDNGETLTYILDELFDRKILSLNKDWCPLTEVKDDED